MAEANKNSKSNFWTPEKLLSAYALAGAAIATTIFFVGSAPILVGFAAAWFGGALVPAAIGAIMGYAVNCIKSPTDRDEIGSSYEVDRIQDRRVICSLAIGWAVGIAAGIGGGAWYQNAHSKNDSKASGAITAPDPTLAKLRETANRQRC
jgi:hypothetical protein